MHKVRSYLTGAVAMVLLVAAGSVWWVHGALAASGSLYVSPSSQSVQVNSNFTVNVRVKPSASIDTVNASISYDAAKVALVSVDCAGSAFSAFPSCPTGGNPVTYTGADLGGSVTADSQVVKLTFTAKAGSGSTTIGLSGNAASAGTATNPSASGATVSFSTPASTPAPAPSTGSGSSGSTGSSSGSSSGSTKSSGSTTPSKSSGPGSQSSGGSSTPTTTTSDGTQTPAAPESTVSPIKVEIASKRIQYSQASFTLKSDQPTQVYIMYGTDKQHYTNTPLSELATSHDVSLDPSLLTPGQTYYYVVVSKDAQGRTTQTDVQTVKTKGLAVTIGVFDKNHQPLRNKTVTLHSDPYTVKTDDKGFATFASVAPGTHHLSYSAGKKAYAQEISIANTVQGSTTQTATPQNVAVVLPVEQSGSLFGNVVPLLLVILLIGAGFIAYRYGLLNRVVNRFALKPQPVVDGPVVVGAPINTSTPTAATAPIQTTAKPSVDQELATLHTPSQPAPGATIAPNPVQENHDEN